MKAAELLRRINRLANRRDWRIEVSEGAGHTLVRLRGRCAVVARHSKDLPPGTFHAILKQLGLTATDLKD